MVKSLLSANQKIFLNFIDSEKSIYNSFYLTGGTALSEFYLQHRFSEDLDFFSEKEFRTKDITLFLNSKKKLFGDPKIEYKQSFNRNIFQLIFPGNDFLKVEFTHFPFKRIDTTKKINNISIDSLTDIAVNKLFTIYQNPRGRDYYDLYFIFKKEKKFSIEKLTKLARIKFDTHIDYIQLGTNLLRRSSLLDDPILENKINTQVIEEFFIRESEKLKDKIIK